MESVRQAVVLAGGVGSRLGPLTALTPKPLLPIGGRPFLDWVVARLAAQGVEDVILTTGYRADAFAEWIARAEGPVRLRTFVEDVPLGTGGALPALAQELDDTFFCLNGDTLFDADLRALALARSETGASGAVALRAVPDISRYGGVRMDGSLVVSFAEKGGSGPGLINGGAYVFDKDALRHLPSPGSIEDDLLPALVMAGALVGLRCEGFFIDIGVPSTYEEAQVSVPAWWAEVNG